MNRWIGKIAVVTGASAGIGAQVSKDLIKAGMIVVGLARRAEKVDALKSDLPEKLRQNLYSAQCDMMKEDDIVKTFSWIEQKFGGVDVLINNAGIIDTSVRLVDEGNSTTIRDTVNTNILGLIFCTREAVKSMKRRSFAGHIVLMNSVAGHTVPNMPSELPNYHINVYCATKYAVTAITETLRQELLKEKDIKGNLLGIKVTSISPAIVQTDFAPDHSAEALADYPHLKAVDISDAVLYTLGTPPQVQIQEIIIKPLGSFF